MGSCVCQARRLLGGVQRSRMWRRAETDEEPLLALMTWIIYQSCRFQCQHGVIRRTEAGKSPHVAGVNADNWHENHPFIIYSPIFAVLASPRWLDGGETTEFKKIPRNSNLGLNPYKLVAHVWPDCRNLWPGSPLSLNITV